MHRCMHGIIIAVVMHAQHHHCRRDASSHTRHYSHRVASLHTRHESRAVRSVHTWHQNCLVRSVHGWLHVSAAIGPRIKIRPLSSCVCAVDGSNSAWHQPVNIAWHQPAALGVAVWQSACSVRPVHEQPQLALCVQCTSEVASCMGTGDSQPAALGVAVWQSACSVRSVHEQPQSACFVRSVHEQPQLALCVQCTGEVAS